MNNLTKYKKVLIIGAEVQPIPPVEGGAVEQLVDLLLQENEKNKFAELTIISPYTDKAQKKSLEYSNSNFIFIDRLNSLNAKIRNFIDLFSRRFFDHSLSNYYIDKVCKLLKEKSDYDLIIVENRPLYGTKIRKVYKNLLYLHLHNDFINHDTRHLKDIVGYYDKYIVISNYLKRRMLEVEEADIEVVYNGIDLNLFSEELKTDGKLKRIVYAGRLVSQKGVLELIKAFKNIKDDEIELDILGTFDYGAEDEKQFKEEFESLVKDDKRIVLVGQLPNEKVANYYKEAYVGVVPSIVNEALSLTAIEMLAAGLPVICTDAGGLIEVVDEGCGLIISRDNLEKNIYDSLCKLLYDEELHDRLANNTKAKANFFSKDNYIENMKRIIENI